MGRAVFGFKGRGERTLVNGLRVLDGEGEMPRVIGENDLPFPREFDAYGLAIAEEDQIPLF